MAEPPPPKRARRTDSSTMWDMNDKPDRPLSRGTPEVDGVSKREPPSKEDGKRTTASRDDRRTRSRSRDRGDRRRDRSRSRDRRDRNYRGSRKDVDRDDRGRRSRDRSISRERAYSRRDYPSKSDRYQDRARDRSRSRSRSPVRNGTSGRTRSPPRWPKTDRQDATRDYRSRGSRRAPNGVSESRRDEPRTRDKGDIPMALDKDLDEDEMDQLLKKTMGFSSFRTTNNTKVPGNNVYGVRKEKKTQYRQYMNRPGGFNRPLSPSR